MFPLNLTEELDHIEADDLLCLLDEDIRQKSLRLEAKLKLVHELLANKKVEVKQVVPQLPLN